MSNQDPSNPYRSTHTGTEFGSPRKVYHEPPAIVVWQLVYCGAMVLLYLGVAAIGVFLYLNAESLADEDMAPTEARVMGIIFAALGVVLSGLFGAGFLIRKGMVGWIFHIVLISIGLTSACCWPTNIPLLIFWIKHKDYIVDSGK